MNQNLLIYYQSIMKIVKKKLFDFSQKEKKLHETNFEKCRVIKNAVNSFIFTKKRDFEISNFKDA